MAKHREDHPVDVDGCFGCKVIGLQLDPGVTKSNGVPTAKQHDK
jgi:hypothetical protein